MSKYQDFLKHLSLSDVELGEAIGVNRSSAWRYRYEKGKLPRRSVAKKIVKLSNGKITMADIYG